MPETCRKGGGAGVSPEASVPPPLPSSAPPGPASPSVLFDFSSAAFTCIIHHQKGPRNAACWVSGAKGRPRKPPDMQRGKSMTPPGWGQPWTPRAHGSSGVGIRVHRVFQLGGSPLCDPGESLNLSVRHQPYCYFDSLREYWDSGDCEYMKHYEYTSNHGHVRLKIVEMVTFFYPRVNFIPI